MGNSKVIHFLKRSLSSRQTREQQSNKAKTSTNSSTRKVSGSSTLMNEPGNFADRPENDGSLELVLGQAFHGVTQEQSNKTPPRHAYEKKAIQDNAGSLTEKVIRPQLSVNTRRQGRQDICIGRSGTYEFVQEDLTSKSYPPTMQKCLNHRNRRNLSLFNNFQWLDLDSTTRDSCFTDGTEKSNDISSIHSPGRSTGGLPDEADAFDQDASTSYHEVFSQVYERRDEAAYASQESISPASYSGTTLSVELDGDLDEDLDEEFGWIPIGYDPSKGT